MMRLNNLSTILSLNILILMFIIHKEMETLSLQIRFLEPYWDEHLSVVLFSYRTTYKVGTGHIPFQLVYGLHSLLPIKYLLPSKPGENKDP